MSWVVRARYAGAATAGAERARERDVGRIARVRGEPRSQPGAGPGRSFNDITIVWQRRQPGRRRAVPSQLAATTLSSPYWPRLSWLAIVQTIRYLPGFSVTLVRTTSPGCAVG